MVPGQPLLPHRSAELVWADNFAFPPMSVSGMPYANAQVLEVAGAMASVEDSVGLWPIHPWPGYHFADHDDAEDPRRSLVDGALDDQSRYFHGPFL